MNCNFRYRRLPPAKAQSSYFNRKQNPNANPKTLKRLDLTPAKNDVPYDLPLTEKQHMIQQGCRRRLF